MKSYLFVVTFPMKHFLFFRIPAFFVTALFLCSCSINLTQGFADSDLQTDEKFSFFGEIPLIYGGDSLSLDESLLKAYTAAASAKAFPREHCRGAATVQASVTENSEKSAWSLGATFIPFWPILPVDETLSYKLTARIFCDGALVRFVQLTESVRIEATLYGIMRSDLINKASREMHQKLVQRLAFELNYGQGNLPTLAYQEH